MELGAMPCAEFFPHEPTQFERKKRREMLIGIDAFSEYFIARLRFLEHIPYNELSIREVARSFASSGRFVRC